MEPSAAAGLADRGNAAYIPRLSYRTNSGEVNSNRDSVSTLSMGFSGMGTPSTVPTSPRSPRFSTSTGMPSPRLPLDSSIASTSPLSTSSSQHGRPSRGSSATPAVKLSAPPAKKEKKGGSFFSFLSVKEPSSQAFEEYEKAMRQRRGRATAVGLPGMSSAKLPPTVPKVNSRWDGVPLAVKEKDRPQNQKRLSVSASVRSQGRNGSADSATPPRSRSGTAHSSGSGNRLAEIYGWESHSNSCGSVAKDFALEHNKPKKTASTTTLPETTLFPTHPPLPVRSISEQPPPPPLVSPLEPTPPPLPELPAVSAPIPELPGVPSNRAELHGEQAPMPELPSPLSTDRAELESPISRTHMTFPNSPPPRNPLRPPPLPELPGDLISAADPPPYHHSPSLTPAEYSPITPGAPPDILFSPNPPSPYYNASAKAAYDAKDGLRTTVLSVPHNTEEVILRSSGVNVLAPPAYTRRQPPRQPFLAGEAEDLVMPEEEVHLQSILKWETTPKNARPALNKAFATPDASPSTLTVKERFLGSTKVTPTATGGSPLSENGPERNITPTPETGGQSMRKKGRMRLFQSSK